MASAVPGLSRSHHGGEEGQCHLESVQARAEAHGGLVRVRAGAAGRRQVRASGVTAWQSAATHAGTRDGQACVGVSVGRLQPCGHAEGQYEEAHPDCACRGAAACVRSVRVCIRVDEPSPEASAYKARREILRVDRDEAGRIAVGSTSAPMAACACIDACHGPMR